MFLKKLSRKKSGKDHCYWALVESVRTARGPRHRVVAYLGELAAEERDGWGRAAATLGRKATALTEPTLFDAQEQSDPVPDHVTVNLNGVRVAGTTDFGDVWLGLVLWRALGLDRLFRRILPRGREAIEWEVMVTILVLGRFCEPSSERHLAQTWYPRTALPELLGVSREEH